MIDPQLQQLITRLVDLVDRLERRVTALEGHPQTNLWQHITGLQDRLDLAEERLELVRAALIKDEPLSHLGDWDNPGDQE